MSICTTAVNIAMTIVNLITNINMPSPTPLKGTDLVDCAKANAKQGIETAAFLCGYGTDLNTFKQELSNACEEMNLQVSELNELITTPDPRLNIGVGEVVAPDSPSDL